VSTASTPRRSVLADGTYDSIRAMIVDHLISPGDHVGIDELARELGVSQTPVREALARLESDGLVTKIPLRGYEATELLSVEQFDDLFQFRGLIEPWAATEAARRASRRAIEALDAEVQRADSLSRADSASTYPEAVEHDTRFHALVARASGSHYVEEAFLRTHCHMHLFRVYKATLSIEDSHPATRGFVQTMFHEYYSGGDRPLALAEHMEIAAAISRGDGTLAGDLMLNHIETSRRRFIPAVEALNAGA
jgi:DNA-binding GntR family transcriptional regulator